MKELTLEDAQEIGRLLSKATSSRPMTDQEIERFYVIPEGATKYTDYESFRVASNNLKNVHYQASCNQDEGLFWTYEVVC